MRHHQPLLSYATAAAAPTAVWTASGALAAAKDSLGAAGTRTSATSFGGRSGTSALDTAASFNGSTWSAISVYPATIMAMGSAGASSASVIGFGGFSGNYATPVANTRAWNGTSWSSGGALSAATGMPAGCGTATAALKLGGSTIDGGSGFTNACSSYNGTTWSGITAMGTARCSLGSSGSTTSANAFGGLPNITFDSSEYWNGTSWTVGATLPVGRVYNRGCGAATATTLAVGGYDNVTAIVSTLYGTGPSWTTASSLNTARYLHCCAGTNTSAVTAGGKNVSDVTTVSTEIFS